MSNNDVNSTLTFAARSLSLALACSPAGAAEFTAEELAAVENQTIEEIIIAETRLNGEVFGMGENLLVDSADILRIQPVDPEQLFQSLPGFSVSRPGGPGGVSEIFLRGAESNFTAVFVDGMRLNNPANIRGGSFDYSLLGIYDIDQINIATGAMSAIYGADAMAGVIRIRSAWDDPGSSNIFLEAGSEEDWRAGIGTTFVIGDNLEWGVRASAVDGGNEIEGSLLRLNSFATRLTGRWPDSGSWEVSLRHAQRDRTSFPEVSGGPQLAIARELETADGDELSIGATGSWGITEAWNSDLYISGSRIRDNVAVPAVAAGALGGQPAFSTITRYQRAQLLWVNRVELSAKVHIVAGVDFVAEDGSDSGEVDLGFAVLPNSYELDRSVSSAFAEFGKLWDGGATTTLAVRWDHDGVEGRLSGKFGITRSVSNSGSQIWGRVANGFKLPSFFALGNPLYGNPNLVTEKVRNVEIGYTHVFDSASELELSLYTSRYDDLVDFDFESSTNVNKGRIDVSGIEVRSSYKLSPTFRLLIDGTWSNITSDSGALRRRPERFGGVGLDWSPAQQWRINLATRYVGSRLTTSIPTGDVNASSFTIIGATVNFEPLPNRKFWIAINNALDEDYQDAPGFPSPGVRIRIGTKLDF